MGVIGLLCSAALVLGGGDPPRYYAHPAVEDDQGVTAPWYTAPNGQWDWRLRVAAGAAFSAKTCGSGRAEDQASSRMAAMRKS